LVRAMPYWDGRELTCCYSFQGSKFGPDTNQLSEPPCGSSDGSILHVLIHWHTFRWKLQASVAAIIGSRRRS
jgi:hypothetical protein